MTPSDVTVFQVLAGLFVLSFIVLTVLVVRFMMGLEKSRTDILAMAYRLEKGMDPILGDLRVGAAQFRVAGEHARHTTEQIARVADKVGRVGTATKSGAKGVWGLLSQAAGAFFNN